MFFVISEIVERICKNFSDFVRPGGAAVEIRSPHICATRAQHSGFAESAHSRRSYPDFMFRLRFNVVVFAMANFWTCATCPIGQLFEWNLEDCLEALK